VCHLERRTEVSFGIGKEQTPRAIERGLVFETPERVEDALPLGARVPHIARGQRWKTGREELLVSALLVRVDVPPDLGVEITGEDFSKGCGKLRIADDREKPSPLRS
jgi:hypothetical protein